MRRRATRLLVAVGLLAAVGCAGPGSVEDRTLYRAPSVSSTPAAASPSLTSALAAEEAPPAASDAATAVCEAAGYARESESLYARLLLVTNDLDDAAAMEAVGEYVRQAEFVGQGAEAMCRAPMEAPNPNLCHNFEGNGIDLFRQYLAADHAIRAAGEADYFAADTEPAEAALEEANKYIGSASATLEAVYC